MTSQITIKREIEKLKEATGTKEPRYILVTYWRPPNVDETGLDIVKREGNRVTIKVKCVE